MVRVSGGAIARTIFAELAGLIRKPVGYVVYVGAMTRPIRHFTAWFVWHSMRISLLEDLKAPRPPTA
jgi:hypothetical protein